MATNKVSFNFTTVAGDILKLTPVHLAVEQDKINWASFIGKQVSLPWEEKDTDLLTALMQDLGCFVFEMEDGNHVTIAGGLAVCDTELYMGDYDLSLFDDMPHWVSTYYLKWKKLEVELAVLDGAKEAGVNYNRLMKEVCRYSESIKIEFDPRDCAARTFAMQIRDRAKNTQLSFALQQVHEHTELDIDTKSFCPLAYAKEQLAYFESDECVNACKLKVVNILKGSFDFEGDIKIVGGKVVLETQSYKIDYESDYRGGQKLSYNANRFVERMTSALDIAAPTYDSLGDDVRNLVRELGDSKFSSTEVKRGGVALKTRRSKWVFKLTQEYANDLRLFMETYGPKPEPVKTMETLFDASDLASSTLVTFGDGETKEHVDSVFKPEDVVSTYTEAEAIDDGFLVDVSNFDIVKNANLGVSKVIITHALWESKISDQEQDVINSNIQALISGLSATPEDDGWFVFDHAESKVWGIKEPISETDEKLTIMFPSDY